MAKCADAQVSLCDSSCEVETPGGELLVDYFRFSIDLGGELNEPVRQEAAVLFSEVALALEGDSFE